MKRLGTEIQSYRNSVAPAGVPRVLRETHRHLAPALANVGIELVPVATSQRSESTSERLSHYVASDPVFDMPTVGPEDVDALLLLQASTTIDFSRIANIRLRRPLPVFAMIHDLLPIRYPNWFAPQAEKSYRVLIQQILHVADHVIVTSHQGADDLMSLGWRIKPAVHILPLGTSFPLRNPRQPTHRAIELLYVSTIEPRKGHRQLIEAFDKIQASGVDVKLTLVGRRGWQVDDLIKGLREHPEFGRSLNWFPGADDALVASLMDRCSVAVLPSEGEGVGLFLEEALSAGTMVVANDIPVFRERPNPNLLYFSGSASSLAATIVEAAQRQPVPLVPGDVRTMRDFAQDLHDLVLDVMDELD